MRLEVMTDMLFKSRYARVNDDISCRYLMRPTLKTLKSRKFL